VLAMLGAEGYEVEAFGTEGDLGFDCHFGSLSRVGV
jgi:hypothetical protein